MNKIGAKIEAQNAYNSASDDDDDGDDDDDDDNNNNNNNNNNNSHDLCLENTYTVLRQAQNNWLNCP